MADYDEKSRSQCLEMVPRATATATPSATAVDLLDFGACTFEMYAGIGGITFTTTNRIDYIVYESDDNSTFTAAGDDALILDPGATAPGGTGIVRSLIAAKAAADTVISTVGYRGKKRYAKCVPTFGGTHGTGTPVGVTVRRGYAYHGPIGASSIET
mgnify:CR=1 FL=1